jgi:hypothetical protein
MMGTPYINGHQELQHLLGGYVLGGLSAADRHRLEEHLPDCVECRAELTRFAVVPGLLQLAAVNGLEPEPATPPVSLPRLLTAAKATRRRQRRRQLLAAAATLVVLAGAVFGFWLSQRPPKPPPSTPLAAVESQAAAQPPSGQVIFESKEWGTQIRLTIYYGAGPMNTLSAFAVAADGDEEQAASWTTPEDGQCYVVGATSIKRDELARVDIRTTDGRTVLRGDG